jgi:small subunit ribosomal protein S20
MPHSASAKKRLRQNVVRRERNRATKSEIKTHVRRLLEQLLAGDVAGAREQFRLVAKKADRAAAGRTIHPNRAARIKSRLSARILAVTRGAGAGTETVAKTAAKGAKAKKPAKG